MANKLEVNLRTGLVTTVEITGDELADLNARQAGETDRAWAELRAQRDYLIAETDWWAVSDRTMTAEQTAYRQALRDLPANTADPSNPTWPTKP